MEKEKHWEEEAIDNIRCEEIAAVAKKEDF